MPRDISVVGFDDLEESGYSCPPLTTMRQDFRALGERAMQLLLLELQGKTHNKINRLIPDLVLRESTGKATKS